MGSTQLVGLEHEPGGLLGWLRRWDCDHYLAQAYRYTHFLRVFDICVPCSKLQWSRWSLAAYSPSTTVFLGDLVDEASEAAPDQMDRWLLACHHLLLSYVQRFHSIYHSSGTRMVYLPGSYNINVNTHSWFHMAKLNYFVAYFFDL